MDCHIHSQDSVPPNTFHCPSPLNHHPPSSQLFFQTPADFMAQAQFTPAGEKMLSDLLARQAAALPGSVARDPFCSPPPPTSSPAPLLPAPGEIPFLPCRTQQSEKHTSGTQVQTNQSGKRGAEHSI